MVTPLHTLSLSIQTHNIHCRLFPPITIAKVVNAMSVIICAFILPQAMLRQLEMTTLVDLESSCKCALTRPGISKAASCRTTSWSSPESLSRDLRRGTTTSSIS